MENKLEFISKTNLSHSLNIYHGGWEICNPSHSFGPAIRTHYLLHYIISGKGTYYVNGNSYSLAEGDGFLILPGESTYYKADNDLPWEYCWISFDGNEVTSILKKCGLSKDKLIFSDNIAKSFKRNILSLINNYKNNSINEFTILGQLYLCFSSLYKDNEINEKNNLQCYSENALDYIYNNFSYDIKVTDIAKHVGIDRTYLYKLFIDKYKVSPQEYLISFRLKIAIKLLKTTNMNITETSYSCGFQDLSTFYKHFKRQYNITPSQYRKRYQVSSSSTEKEDKKI